MPDDDPIELRLHKSLKSLEKSHDKFVSMIMDFRPFIEGMSSEIEVSYTWHVYIIWHRRIMG